MFDLFLFDYPCLYSSYPFVSSFLYAVLALFLFCCEVFYLVSCSFLLFATFAFLLLGQFCLDPFLYVLFFSKLLLIIARSSVYP